ncbi:MAG: ABC transporter ATP-binding protein [Candidatus Nanopelagicaceae bacterium]|nr:ABC transporter ATP-binding protein [Candidatus Nanopelagicaceae bacterium]
MVFIAKEMIAGFRHLFPRGRFRFVLIVLSLIAAGISVSELLVMKFFATLVLHEGDYDNTKLAIAAVGFFAFFVITRVGQFYQRNYRVKAFARSFRAAKKDRTVKEENREWAMAFELTNVVSLGTQLVAIIAFFLFLNPMLALINAVVLMVILQVVGGIFRKQIAEHAQLNALGAKKVRADKRYGIRIKAAETGALVSGAGTLFLLALLLFLSIDGQITPANTLVVFLGVRLQNSVISNASRSLMRYAKSNSRTEVDDDSE